MRFLNFFSRLLDGLLQLVYPPVCLICDESFADESPIKVLCGKCLNSFKEISPEFVRQQIINRLEPCYLDELYILVQFDESFQKLIYQVKYNKMNRLAYQVTDFLLKKDSVKQNFVGKKQVVPVPLHPVREKESGYNQSLHIASALVDQADLMMKSDILVRSRATSSQTELNREARESNVNGAFHIKKPELVEKKDIVFLMIRRPPRSTLNECARILKLSGARKVIGFALATPLM
jgi:predicted amidophosphoribosyltransferase